VVRLSAGRGTGAERVLTPAAAAPADWSACAGDGAGGLAGGSASASAGASSLCASAVGSGGEGACGASPAPAPAAAASSSLPNLYRMVPSVLSAHERGADRPGGACDRDCVHNRHACQDGNWAPAQCAVRPGKYAWRQVRRVVIRVPACAAAAPSLLTSASSCAPSMAQRRVRSGLRPSVHGLQRHRGVGLVASGAWPARGVPATGVRPSTSIVSLSTEHCCCVLLAALMNDSGSFELFQPNPVLLSFSPVSTCSCCSLMQGLCAST